MIICVSANPAIDRRIKINNFRLGEVNRVNSSISLAGGKAAHVAMAASVLGEKVIWIGFLGGTTGVEVERQLKNFPIDVFPVKTDAATRVNDEIISGNGQITEILEKGGAISETEISLMFETCEKQFALQNDVFQLVISGSLPPNVAEDFYFELIKKAKKYRANVILDTSGKALERSLSAAPDLIKPNQSEAENLTGLKITDEDSAKSAIRKIQQMGAKKIALSLGERGVILADEKDCWLALPPKVKVISTVGSGDSMVAGFAAGFAKNLSREHLLRLAVACGTANCLADFPGQIKVENVQTLQEQVVIKEILR